MNHVDREGCLLFQMSAFRRKTLLLWLWVTNLCLTLLIKRQAFSECSFFLLFGRTCASLSHRTLGFGSNTSSDLHGIQFSKLQFSSVFPTFLHHHHLLCPFYRPAPSPAAPVTVDAAPRVSTGRACGVMQTRLALARPAQATL